MSETSGEESATEDASAGTQTEQSDEKPDLTYGPDQDDGQDYVDRSNLDFDPEDGLYSGTAVEGDTDIPGPHAGETEDVDPSDDSEARPDDEDDSDDDSEDDDSGEAAGE